MSGVRPIALVAVLVAIVAAAIPAAGTSSADSKNQACGHYVTQYTTGPELVFGRAATQAAAEALRAHVARVGFTNASIEEECSDFRVVVRGYDTFDTAVALQAEARRTPFRPTVECYQSPDKLGEIEVAMGNARDLRSAEDLARLYASRNFAGAKLEADSCGGYEVMIHGFTSVAQAQAFIVEANSVGFAPRLEANS